MFEGRLAGKGVPAADGSGTVAMALGRVGHEVVGQDCDLEVVVTHDGLFDILNDGTKGDIRLCVSEPLKAFRDRTAGLYGLRRGNLITVKPEYRNVFGVCDGYAVVEKSDAAVCVVDGDGGEVQPIGRNQAVKLLKGGVASVTGRNGAVSYIDLKNGSVYHERPTVVMYGDVVMLKAGRYIFSRTRKGRVKAFDSGNCNLTPHGFYVKVVDYGSVGCCRSIDEPDGRWGSGVSCIIAGDYDEVYGFCGQLADGGIIVVDADGVYYHVEDGKGKRRIACERPESAEEDFAVVVPRLKAEAVARASAAEAARRSETAERRVTRLAGLQGAMPFRSGMKWGLKFGERIIVPPVYRNIQAPVGCFCAFEACPCRWGVITLDGRVVIEARYSKVEIGRNGTARLTLVQGDVKTVKLVT